MSRLEKLQAANPQLKIYSVLDEEFLRYGRVIDIDTEEFPKLVLDNVVLPAEGCEYVTDLPVIDKSEKAQEYNQLVCGQLDEQWGLCWGHNDAMNALEWHTCNEFNIGVTDLILLLAKRGDLDKNNRLDADKVKAFYLPKAVMVEVYSDSLHYAPCEVDKNGFYCVVGLQRGTNFTPDPSKKMDKILGGTNKWLIFHDPTGEKESDCIFGENWKVNPIE